LYCLVCRRTWTGRSRRSLSAASLASRPTRRRHPRRQGRPPGPGRPAWPRRAWAAAAAAAPPRPPPPPSRPAPHGRPPRQGRPARRRRAGARSRGRGAAPRPARPPRAARAWPGSARAAPRLPAACACCRPPPGAQMLLRRPAGLRTLSTGHARARVSQARGHEMHRRRRPRCRRRCLRAVTGCRLTSSSQSCIGRQAGARLMHAQKGPTLYA